MSEYILEIENLTKEFPGVKALTDVSLKVKKGEIHSLCGENGAGKSTLMSCISGVYPKDSYTGKIFFKGHETHYNNVKNSETEGLSIIYQEHALSPYLSIYENIFLGHMETKFGVIDWDRYLKEAEKYLEIVGLDEPPETIVCRMGVGKQKMVEIARALSKKIDLLIMDEPTSFLNDDESEKLLDLMLELKKHGMTLIMISHKLNEVLKVADTVTILRDGKSINAYDVKADNLTEEMIIRDMVGRVLTHRFPERKPQPVERTGDKRVMVVRNWTVYHPDYDNIKLVDNVTFHLNKGEILAFTGAMGAGRTALMMSLFGGSTFRSVGELILHGKNRIFKNPRSAIHSGLCYVSEDRKSLSLILMQDVKTNITQFSMDKVSTFGVIDDQKEIEEAERYREELHIKTSSINQKVGNLSGGNQQKVVISKSLMVNPDVLILDEPTRGIDVGSKTEIYEIMNNMVEAGKSIIMVSSELPEVLGMADRIYVMNKGQIRGELSREEATQEIIMHLALVQ